MLQCLVVCYSVLQLVAVCCSVGPFTCLGVEEGRAICCSAL